MNSALLSHDQGSELSFAFPLTYVDSFTKYILSTSYMSGNDLDVEDTIEKKRQARYLLPHSGCTLPPFP